MKFTSGITMRSTACVSVLCALCSSLAGAADFSYRATVGAYQTDNIARTPTNAQSETILAPGLQFSLGQLSPRLQADVLGDFAYNEYVDNTYDSEVLGNFMADAHLALIPQRFEWALSDNFGQVVADPFAPVTPENRENINRLSTGPDLTLGLGASTRVQLGGRYTLTSYETSPFDSDSITGQLALIRLLSDASSVSFNVRNQSVAYDEFADADYDQADAYLRYQVKGARTNLALDAGYSRLDADSSADTQGGALIRLEVSRRVSMSSRLSLNLGREFMSAGGAFASAQGAASIDLTTTPGRQTVQPFVADHVNVGWDFVRYRTGFSVQGAWTDQSYRDNPLLDQKLATFTGTVRRDIARSATLSVNSVYSKAVFDQPGGDYDEWAAGVSVLWRLTRSLSLTASFLHSDRSSDFALGNYKENRVSLLFGYGRGEPRTTRVAPSFGIDTVDSGG